MASLNNAEMGRARANSNDEVWEVPTNWVVEKGNKPSSQNRNIGAFSKLASFFPATNRKKTEANRVFSRPAPVNTAVPFPVPAAVDPTIAARPTALPRTPLRPVRVQQVAPPIPAKRPIQVVVQRKNRKNRSRKNRKNRKVTRKYRR